MKASKRIISQYMASIGARGGRANKGKVNRRLICRKAGIASGLKRKRAATAAG